MNVSNLDLRGCGFSLKTKQNNSSISDDYPQAEDKWSGGGEGGRCRTSKAGVGHLGQPSMSSGRPCYPVSNRWSSLHHSLPGCRLSGWKCQHPGGEVSGSESHWTVTGWSVQTLSYENDFPSSDSMSSASPPHMGKSKCMTLSSTYKILSFPDADQLLALPQESFAQFCVFAGHVESMWNVGMTKNSQDHQKTLATEARPPGVWVRLRTFRYRKVAPPRRKAKYSRKGMNSTENKGYGQGSVSLGVFWIELWMPMPS